MDAATLHSVSELITSIAVLVGVVGFVVIVGFLLGAIRQRILSGADLDLKMPGSSLTVHGRPISPKDALTNVTEVVPSLLQSVTAIEARLKALEAGAIPALPAPATSQDAELVPNEQGPEVSPSGEVPSRRAGPEGEGNLGQPHLLWIDWRPKTRIIQIQQAIQVGWQVTEYVDFYNSLRALEQTFFDGVVYVWLGDNADFAQVRQLTDVIKRQPLDKRTRLLVYAPERTLRADRVDEVLRQGATMVTFSAVELAVALDGTYCGQCGRLLAEPGTPFPGRQPCPQCGSTVRRFVRRVFDALGPTSDSASTSSQ